VHAGMNDRETTHNLHVKVKPYSRPHNSRRGDWIESVCAVTNAGESRSTRPEDLREGRHGDDEQPRDHPPQERMLRVQLGFEWCEDRRIPGTPRPAERVLRSRPA
jgi:hypothetical protein